MRYKLFIIGILFVEVGCKKTVYVKCTNAQVCVTNVGSLNLPYTWGASSQLKDTLRPGQSACSDAGYLNTDPSIQSYSIVYFTTPSKGIAIRPTSCNTHTDVVR